MWYVIRSRDGDYAIVNHEPNVKPMFQSPHRRMCEMFVDIRHQNVRYAKYYVRTVAVIAGVTFLVYSAVSDLLGNVGGW